MIPLEECGTDYRIIYADPPWAYACQQHNGIEAVSSPDNKYPTMDARDIGKIPIRYICSSNATLFLWATAPLLPDAMEVIRAWGFKYKTGLVWDKCAHNVGWYSSVQHEHLLIAGRGASAPDRPFKLIRSIVSIPRGRHSEKPQYFKDWIDTLYRTGRRIELFARMRTPGWDVWGYDVDETYLKEQEAQLPLFAEAVT